MQRKFPSKLRTFLFFLLVGSLLFVPVAQAANCTTQSQMTAAQRDALTGAAHALINDVQSGNVEALKTNTIPAVAADFSGIAASAAALKPQVQHAAITVNDLYLLDASGEPAGAPETDFYCGTPIVVFNFTNLPPGKYAMAIIHATGVPQPQQISLILSETSENHWMLAGFFTGAMVQAGHDGLWYWSQARAYAQKKMNWNAWFYYQTAATLLDPVQFMSSPNLQKLEQEASATRPDNLPGTKPMTLSGAGTTFQVTSLGVTTELGGFDLELHYSPDPTQLTELRDPVAARKQAIAVMTALLTAHPELREAFHGIWARADLNGASVYALELPMNQIVPAGQTPVASAVPVQAAIPASLPDPTKPESQPSLTVDNDPIPSPDVEKPTPVSTAAVATTGKSGEIQKTKNGMYTLHEDVNEVVLNCTVVNDKGKLVDGLQRSNFRIWEDGVPQTIESFQHQDLPVSMGILVDNSGSMRDKRAAVNAAALELVKESNPRDAAFIVNFSDRAYLDQGFTSNIDALEKGLSHYDSKSTTALYDAVVASADELAKHAEQPKQVLLIVTDGADNASRLTLQQAIRRVQNLGGPVVYSIGLLFGDDKQEAQTAKTALQSLSDETGGLAYFPDSLADVDDIALQVARDIRDQYTLGYHSTKSASLGGYRRVRVEAEQGPKHTQLIVRTKRGYYPNGVKTKAVAP